MGALLAVQRSTANNAAVARKVRAAAQWAQLGHEEPNLTAAAAPPAPSPQPNQTGAAPAGNLTLGGNTAAPANLSFNTSNYSNYTEYVDPGPDFALIVGQMDDITNQAQAAAMTANDMVDIISEIPQTITYAETGEA